MPCYRFIVTGRVQGVFYRASARNKAQQLGLLGWVRNLSSGDVELLACGETESISKLQSWLWQGPQFAKVKAVSRVLVEAGVDELKEFDVRPNG